LSSFLRKGKNAAKTKFAFLVPRVKTRDYQYVATLGHFFCFFSTKTGRSAGAFFDFFLLNFELYASDFGLPTSNF